VAGRVDSAAAETHVRLLAEKELRRAATTPRYLWPDRDSADRFRPPDEEGVVTVSAVVDALCQVGALTAARARQLFTDFAGAMAARDRHSPSVLVPDEAGMSARRPSPAASPPAAPDGLYQALPVGVVVPGVLNGLTGLAYLQTLVLGPSRATITMTHVPEGRETTVPADQPSFAPFGGSGVTDDRGRQYALAFRSEDGGWHDGGALDLSPIPPAGTRWLDLPIRPGVAIRISLTGPAPQAKVASVPIAPAPVGELLLDAVAEALLGGGPMAGTQARLLATRLAEVVAALEAVGALPRGSPAADRLAALCQQRAIDVHGPLAVRARTATLPGPWSSVLARDRDEDGPAGVVAAAAVLPELEGARIVLAGLVSWERRASLPVLAWGWGPASGRFRAEQPLSWWAHDDAGRWHVGRINVGGYGYGVDFHLELTPPLHADARSLDIIVTGRSKRVTVTIPLNWQQPLR
jgi:hypothetical protein